MDVRQLGVFLGAAAAVSSCGNGSYGRDIVESSEPRVACARTDTSRGAKNEREAVQAARSVLASFHEKNPSDTRYNPSNLAQFEPYSASLKDGVWHVNGRIPVGFSGYAPVVSVCRNDEGAASEWVRVP